MMPILVLNHLRESSVKNSTRSLTNSLDQFQPLFIIAVSNPQQAPLWWKLAAARSQQGHCDCHNVQPRPWSQDGVQCNPHNQGCCQPGRCPVDGLAGLWGLTVKAQCLGACMHAFWKLKRKEKKRSSSAASLPPCKIRHTKFLERKEGRKMNLQSPSMKTQTNLTLEERNKKLGSLLSQKINHT